MARFPQATGTDLLRRKVTLSTRWLQHYKQISPRR
jgi:hypothetical protein